MRCKPLHAAEVARQASSDILHTRDQQLEAFSTQRPPQPAGMRDSAAGQCISGCAGCLHTTPQPDKQCLSNSMHCQHVRCTRGASGSRPPPPSASNCRVLSQLCLCLTLLQQKRSGRTSRAPSSQPSPLRAGATQPPRFQMIGPGSLTVGPSLLGAPTLLHCQPSESWRLTFLASSASDPRSTPSRETSINFLPANSPTFCMATSSMGSTKYSTCSNAELSSGMACTYIVGKVLAVQGHSNMHAAHNVTKPDEMQQQTARLRGLPHMALLGHESRRRHATAPCQVMAGTSCWQLCTGKQPALGAS